MENKHYIRINSGSSIQEGWSDGPLPDKDITSAICIREDGSYLFRLYPDGQENPTLFDENGIPLYKWEGQVALKRTPAEIAAELAAMPNIQPEPTIAERLDATEAALLALMEDSYV